MDNLDDLRGLWTLQEAMAYLDREIPKALRSTLAKSAETIRVVPTPVLERAALFSALRSVEGYMPVDLDPDPGVWVDEARHRAFRMASEGRLLDRIVRDICREELAKTAYQTRRPKKDAPKSASKKRR